MKKFEYRAITMVDSNDEDTEVVLNELGEEGWELVNAHPYDVVRDIEEREEETDNLVTYYLKREKQ